MVLFLFLNGFIYKKNISIGRIFGFILIGKFHWEDYRINILIIGKTFSFGEFFKRRIGH